MKKIYLCAIALSVGSLSFGQQLTGKAFSEKKSQKTLAVAQAPGTTTPNHKAPGDIIWAEDFTGGMPAGWSVLDNTGNNAVWVLQAAGALPDADFTTGLTTIASTSGGNCMLLYSDLYESPPPAGGYYEMDSYFQTAPIALTGQAGVSVNFEQSFRNCCSNVPAPVASLVVSTDPTFATNVASFDIIGGVGTNVASADPMDMSINITSIAGGVNGNIYLRWHIVSGIEAYYWMIDDIEVVESPVNDMVTVNGFYGFFGVQYTRVPYEHIQPIDFSMQVTNIGVADQTNSNLTVTVTDGGTTAFTTSSVDTTLNSLSTDTLELPLAWTPPVTPSDWDIPYTVTLDILSDSSDFTPANNGIVFPPFEISQFVMALDDHSSTPGNGGGNAGPGGVTEYEAGNQFDAIVNDDLYALELVTGSNTPVGTFIDVVLYQIDFTATPATYTQVWRSASYTVVAGDIGVVHSFYNAAGPNTPIASLIAGETYFAAVHSFIDYEYGTSGLNPPAGTPAAAHSAIRYPNMATPNANSSFGLTATPMIRLNFDGTVNIEVTNDEVTFNVYPNPSNGLFNINLSSDEANNVQLSVKNLVGQTIINETVSVSGKTNHSISLADYSKGVYFLTVGNETVKLIVE